MYYILCHSAKGSSWKKHKYIKRIDGTYYYPDSYEGGRHLPDGESSGGGGGALEDWEKDLYADLEDTLKRNPGLFKLSEVASNDFQDFRVTLAEFAGIDADELSDEEVERMRKKVEAHYSEESDDSNDAQEEPLSETDIENLAREVIRGNFGNGQVRKDLLGEDYQIIQDRVNEILLGGSSSSGGTTKATRIEDAKSKIEGQGKLETESAVKKLSDTKTDLTKAMEKAITVFVNTGKNLKKK